MTELLEGWDPETHPEVVEMVRHLANALLADDDKLLADAKPARGLSPPGPGAGRSPCGSLPTPGGWPARRQRVVRSPGSPW